MQTTVVKKVYVSFVTKKVIKKVGIGAAKGALDRTGITPQYLWQSFDSAVLGPVNQSLLNTSYQR